jgi:hypothetical protein
MENSAFDRVHDFLHRGVWEFLADPIRSVHDDPLSPFKNLVYRAHPAGLVATPSRVLLSRR